MSYALSPRGWICTQIIKVFNLKVYINEPIHFNDFFFNLILHLDLYFCKPCLNVPQSSDDLHKYS